MQELRLRLAEALSGPVALLWEARTLVGGQKVHAVGGGMGGTGTFPEVTPEEKPE